MTNPDWVKDEVILALDLYFKEKTAIGNANHPAVIELSNFLNKLPLIPDGFRDEKFRNPNGVGMKLANFRRLDPNHSGTGLTGGNKLEEEVWNEFHLRRGHLAETAAAIREVYDLNGLIPFLQQDFDEDEEAPEGRILTAVHLKRERSKKLVNKKKKQAMHKYGKLECEACGFDYAVAYDSGGLDCLECHHEKPLSSLEENSKTKLKDLRLVCPNCHRIIHKRKPWLSIDEVKNILKAGC